MVSFKKLHRLRVPRWNWKGLFGDEATSEKRSVDPELSNTSVNSSNFPEPFKYQYLDQSSKSSIRLATLHPGPKNSQPCITMSNSAWQNNTVSYEALSYVWGDEKAKKRITVDGSNFEITENLYSALIHIRFEDRPRVLWIDAICIDQSNIKEKNHQVASMAEIYENCQRVIVWLGDEYDQVELLPTFIENVIQVMQEKLPNGQALLSNIGLSNLYGNTIQTEVIDAIFSSDLIPGWRRFFPLVRSQWWRRAWVVQEFATAPDAIFCVGKFSFDWMMICLLIITLDSGRRLPRLSHLKLGEGESYLVNAALDVYFSRLKWQNKKLHQNSHKGLSQKADDFVNLLHSQVARNCGDSRDKVYSILSIADSEIRQVLHPDYSKPTRSVFIATVRAYVDTFKDLNILGYKPHEPAPEYPSWCPDWRSGRKIMTMNYYKASAKTAATATFSEDESTIYINGFHVGTVEEHSIQGTSDTVSANKDWTTLSWDLGAMASKIQHGCRHMQTGTPEVELETCATIIAETMVTGRWQISNSNYEECPPLVTDPVTGEWWLGDDKRMFNYIVCRRASGRTVILCDNKKVGLAPRGTRVGDEIWIFLGAATPFVIRRIDGESYILIGECFVHGIMKGEAMEDLRKGRYKLSQVALR